MQVEGRGCAEVLEIFYEAGGGESLCGCPRRDGAAGLVFDEEQSGAVGRNLDMDGL